MLAMGRLGPAALALAFVLIAPGRASADIVARGVHDGSLACLRIKNQSPNHGAPRLPTASRRARS